MVIDFSKLNLKEKPTLVLKNLDGTAVQTLGYAFNINGDIYYNEVSTINFDLPATVDGIKTPNYANVVGMKIIDLVNVGQFILIDPSTESNGVKEIKHCKAYSLEYEWVKKSFFIEAGTFNFYDPLSPENTIIGRLLEKMSDWTIGSIDSSLIGKYRTFEDTSTNCYNFVKSNVQETYGCIFDFDTYNRKIYVVSVDSTVPIRQVYLSQERLVHDVEINENSDEIVTCLDVNGEEGVSIRTVNPTGTNKIYNLDYFMNTSNFSQELIDKWYVWENTCKSYQLPYYNTMIEYNLKTSQYLAEQAKLADLQGELSTLQNQQAVIIQAIAQNLQTQSALTAINTKIAAKNSEIAAQESAISKINTQISNLIKSLSEINQLLAMDHKTGNKYTYFTPAELTILKRYFIEDSLEDSSFAMPSTTTYDNVDISNSISNVSASIVNSTVTTAINTSSQKMYSFSGGTLNIGGIFSAKIVQATIDLNSSGKTLVFSAYLERGNVSDVDFTSGTITISGTGTAALSGTTGLSMFIESATLYFTRNSTEYEQHSVEWDLFEYGQSVLYEKASPSYNFSVQSGNFLAIEDFETFKNSLVLGQRVYLNLDDNILTPYMTMVHIDYDNLSTFSIEFGNTYTSFDSVIRLSKLLEQSVSMGKSLNTKSGMYSEFVKSKASTKVKDFMSSALDIAKNAVMSSGEQAITFDDSGLRIRKWKNKEAGTYEDEQIWMVDNMIAFTVDAWNTANMAIGKIFDENIKNYIRTSDTSRDTSKTYYTDTSGTVWDGSTAWSTNLYELSNTAYGIVAPYLVGTILAGSNLVIDTENGSFRVDSSGVYIDSLKFYITHGSSEYDTTLGDALNELSEADNKIADDLYDSIKGLKEDYIPSNTVTTYYQGSESGVPNGKTGDLWYVNGTEDIIVGDVTYSAGTLYRYNGTEWQKIEDADATTAIANAATAQSTADRKIVSYYQNYPPTEPDYGDIWFNTAEDNKVVRTIEVGDNLSGKTLNYAAASISTTEDKNFIVAGNNRFYSNGKTVTRYIGSQSTVIYRNKAWITTTRTVPTTFGIVTEVDKTSIFYQYITAEFTNEYTPGKLYRYNGTEWKLVEDSDIDALKDADAQAAQNLADAITDINDALSKTTTTYYTDTIPENPNVGDLWYYTGEDDAIGFVYATYDSVTGKKTNASISLKKGHLYRYDGTIWQELEDANAIQAIENAATAQATADGKIMFYQQDYTKDGLPVINEHSEGDIWFNTAEKDSDGYEAGKLYRCDGTRWIKVEDKDISVLKEDVETINTTISEFYNSGYLDTKKLKGTIDAQLAQMQSSKGNVLFDSDGIWLMNATSKSQATKAIWMNENGILFGSGSKSSNPGSSSSGWTWTTAINHDGITATALAGKTLSGVTVYVGDGLYVGPKAGGGYNFTVDKNGKLTATSGDFTGNVNASNIKLMNSKGAYSSILTTTTAGSQKISSEYLDLLGITIRDSKGNIAMSINSSGVHLYGGTIKWESGISTDNISGLATVATTGNYNSLTNKPNIPTIPSYITSTKITSTTIESPNITGGTVTGAVLNSVSEKVRKVTIQDGGINFYTYIGRNYVSDGFIADDYNGYFTIASSYQSIKLSSIYYLLLEASSGLVLNSSSMYGSSLPRSGTTGRIFFLTS